MTAKTLIMKTAELEALTEAMASAMGELSTRILIEEEKPNPNIELIQSTEKRMESIQRERNSIDPDNEHQIQSLLNKYSKKRSGMELSDDFQS